MKHTKMPIGRNMKIRRIALDMSIKEVAGILKVNPASIGYLEKRADKAVFIQHLKLLKKYGTDLNKLFD